MFKNSEKVSYRRFHRKYKKEGTAPTLVASVEYIGREYVFQPFVNKLINFGIIQTCSDNTTNSFPPVFSINNHRPNHNKSPDIPFVAHLLTGFVIPKYGVILDEDKCVINQVFQPKDSCGDVISNRLSRMAINDPTMFYQILNINSMAWAKTPNLDTIAPLFPYYVNYYHWLIKTLPKVRYIKKYKKHTGENIKFLVPPSAPGWVEDTLKLVNVSDENIIEPENKIYKTKDLIAPSWVEYSINDFIWMKKKMINNVTSKTQSKKNITNENPTNIFISREDAFDRQITNREEVLKMLKKYGFEKYILSDRSIVENIQLFKHSNIIVGAHGAGLADIIFADNASVIELYGSRHTTTYESLANKLDLRYTKLHCEPMYTDIRVDIAQLESAVRDAL